MVVLDACRDNPFVKAHDADDRGLDPVDRPRAGAASSRRRGALVALCRQARPGGAGRRRGNSPFVSALVRHMQTPGIEINKVFRLVRDEVLTATNNSQEPFVYGTLPAQDFYFASR